VSRAAELQQSMASTVAPSSFRDDRDGSFLGMKKQDGMVEWDINTLMW